MGSIIIADNNKQNKAQLISLFEKRYSVAYAVDKAELCMAFSQMENIEALVISLDMENPSVFDVICDMKASEEHCNIPIIVISQKSSEAEMAKERRAMQMGASDRITLPIAEEAACERIVNAVAKMQYLKAREENIHMSFMLKRNDAIKQMLSTMPNGVLYLDIDTARLKVHVDFFNLAAAQLVGYPVEVLKSEYEDRLLELVYKDDREAVMRDLKLMLESKEKPPSQMDIRIVTHDGTLKWVRVRASSMDFNNGRINRLCMITDISYEKDQETAKILATTELKNFYKYDKLTNVYNREAFFNKTAYKLEENPDKQYNIVVANVVNFNLVNDLYGRYSGDSLLVSIAEAIRKHSHLIETYGRLESDHFVMCVERKKFEKNIDKLKKVINYRFEENEKAYEIVLSYGVYEINDKSISVDRMCDRALLALNKLDNYSESNIMYYNESMRSRLIYLQQLASEAKLAIKNKEFKVYLQPVCSVNEMRPVSAEALVRWHKPNGEVVFPSDFIPFFEETGFITKLDRYICEEVIIYQKSRAERGLSPMPISINVSRRSVLSYDVCGILTELADRYGVDPSLIRIEITESMYSVLPELLEKTTSSLNQAGFKVLMDDFGSGYSSLILLDRMHVDILKIDMRFLENFEKNDRIGIILTAIMRMTSWLGMPTVAEGVETANQLEYLQSIGCDYIQGHCFSRAIEIAEFEKKFDLDDTIFVEKSRYDYSKEEIGMIMGSNHFINRLFDSIFGGVVLLQESAKGWEIIRVNKSFYENTGYTSEDFNNISTNIDNFVLAEDIEKMYARLKTSKQQAVSVRAHIRHIHKNGSILYFYEVYRYIGKYGGNDIYFVAYTNETENVLAKAKSDREVQRVKALESYNNISFVEVDHLSYAISLSEGFAKRFDIQRFDTTANADTIKEEGLAKRWKSIIHPDDYELFHQNILKLKHPTAEVRIRMRSGEYRWQQISYVEMHDEDGNIESMMYLINDIDEKKNAVTELEQKRNELGGVLQHTGCGVCVYEYNNGHIQKLIYANDTILKMNKCEQLSVFPYDKFDISGYIKKRGESGFNQRVEELVQKGHKEFSFEYFVDDENEERKKHRMNALTIDKNAGGGGLYIIAAIEEI